MLAKTEPFATNGLLPVWFGSPLFGWPLVIPTRTEIVSALLSSKDHLNKAFYYNMIRDFFGTGLVVSECDVWSRHRKLLNPVFNLKLLNDFNGIMNNHAIKLVDSIKGTESQLDQDVITNLPELISKATMGIICETALGTHDDVDGKNSEPMVTSGYTEAAEEFDKMMLNRLGNPIMCIDAIYKFTKEGRRHGVIKEFLKREGMRLIKKRIANMRQDDDCNQNEINGKRKSCLIDTLIQEHMRDPRVMTINDISDEVDTFLAAGHDTTTWALVWTLFLLGHHPEAQQKILKEYDGVLNEEYNQILFAENEEKNQVTPQVLSKLKYLDCVINESLRLYPIVPFYGRRLEKDLNYSLDGKNHTIPTGTHFVIHPDLIHTSSRYYDDPERFVPERFSTASKEPGKCSDTFLPFSLGSRNCIGKTFAKLEEKIILIHLLQQFEIISLNTPDKVKINYALARRCQTELKFKFVPRKM